MFKKPAFYVTFTVISFVMIIGSLFVNLNSVSGLLLGTGAGILGGCIAQLYLIKFEKKNPKVVKENEIEFRDERNVLIRQKAKAKSADIIQWLIMGFAFLSILISAPLWLTLVAVGIFVLYNIIQIYYMSKFNKEI